MQKNYIKLSRENILFPPPNASIKHTASGCIKFGVTAEDEIWLFREAGLSPTLDYLSRALFAQRFTRILIIEWDISIELTYYSRGEFVVSGCQTLCLSPHSAKYKCTRSRITEIKENRPLSVPSPLRRDEDALLAQGKNSGLEVDSQFQSNSFITVLYKNIKK